MKRIIPVVLAAIFHPAVAADSQAAKDAVLAYFKSGEETAVKDAVWTSSTMFKVGALDNGSNRNGYAMYVCETLRENGLRRGYTVEVVDIVSIAQGKAWRELGAARCD